MGDEALEGLVQHMLAASPDHIAVTGDLINLALKEEIRLARLWLERLGAPENVSVVPGNHDTYVRGALDRIIEAWRPYLTGDVRPMVRRRPLALSAATRGCGADRCQFRPGDHAVLRDRQFSKAARARYD